MVNEQGRGKAKRKNEENAGSVREEEKVDEGFEDAEGFEERKMGWRRERNFQAAFVHCCSVLGKEHVHKIRALPSFISSHLIFADI